MRAQALISDILALRMSAADVAYKEHVEVSDEIMGALLHSPHATRLELAENLIPAGERTQLAFPNALTIAEHGFDVWAAKVHNAKWVRLIDGTPIKNDLLVNIALAFCDPPSLHAPPSEDKT